MIAQGQHTICDLNDITTGSSAPTSPVVNQLWCDTSITPNQLKKWNGSTWEVVNEVKVGGRNLARNSKMPLIWYCGYGGNPIDSSSIDVYNKVVNGVFFNTALNINHKATGTGDWRFSSGGYNEDINSNFDFFGNDITISYYIISTKNVVLRQLITNRSDYDGGSKDFTLEEGKLKFISFTSKFNFAPPYPGVRARFNLFSDAEVKIFFVKLELGNIATDWTPAPEDVAADIALAQQTANTAVSNAASAQTSADAANAVIAKIADDDVLTPSEKQQALREWLVAVSEKPLNVTQAASLGVDSSAYSSAYDSLASFIGTNLNDVTSTWTMGVGNGSLFRNRFSSYYTARTNLLNAISTKVNTSATNANTKIDGLKVGGRNLILNSNSTAQNQSSYIIAEYSLSSNLIVDTDYIATIHGSLGAGKTDFMLYDTSSMGVYYGSFTKINDGVYSKSIRLSEILGNGTKLAIGAYPNNGTLGTIIENIKLEIGNIATDYSEAPEDIQARIDAAKAAADAAKSKVDLLDYLKDNMIKGGIVEAGMYLANILAVRNAAGMVTGGMNGLTDNTAKGNVFLWGGGTLDAAENSATNPAGVATIDRKDGSGHRAKGALLWTKEGVLKMLGGFIGNFAIIAGKIVGKDSQGVERIVLSSEAITPLANMGNTTVYIPAEFGGYTRTLLNGNNHYAVLSVGVEFTLPIATVIDIDYGQPAFLYSYLPAIQSKTETISLHIWKNGVEIATSSTGVAMNIAATGVMTAELRIEVNANLNSDGQGEFETYVDISNAMQNSRGITYMSSINRTEIGSDGLSSYWGANNYFRYTQLDGLRVKGATDIPGILATGSVASGGGTSNLWGAKKSTLSATYTATGLYRVYHALNSSAYTVNINCTTAGAIGTIVAKGTTYVDIQIYRNGANYQCGFDYSIFGAN